MTPGFAAKLSPARQRVLAVAHPCRRRRVAPGAGARPAAAAASPLRRGDRRYHRSARARSGAIAAQAPELRRALEAMKERDGRRFFLKNTAPNLAGAELQELVQGDDREATAAASRRARTRRPRDEGRFRQIGVNVQFFATTPALQKILNALESQLPYLVVDNLTVRPLNAFRGFKPAPGAGAGDQRAARRQRRSRTPTSSLLHASPRRRSPEESTMNASRSLASRLAPLASCRSRCSPR